MINLIVRIIVCCWVPLLTSCLHRSLPANYASCVIICKNRLAACANLCSNNCAHCSAVARKSAARSYGYYEHERYVQGKILALQLNSFRDPLKCRKITCNCQADFQICIQSCGGAVTKRLEHAPLCG